jgi:hypothetical protein
LSEGASTDGSLLLRGVAQGFRTRRDRGSPEGDGDLLAEVATLRNALERQLPLLDQDIVPPRRVGMAMVLALYSQPHLVSTFGDYRQGGTEEVSEPDQAGTETVALVPGDILEATFGIPQWELDDLRDEVDRRAGRVLKQLRAVNCLWTRFRLPQAGPEPLLRALFPGHAPIPGRVGVVRRGAQLYILCDQSPPADPASLFLPWVAPAPLVFDPRKVDLNTREELVRGIGATDEELLELLGMMITVVPRSDAIRWLVHDGWRSRGHAALSALGARYRSAPTLARPLAADDVEWSQWLTPVQGRLEVGDAAGEFAGLARGRAEAATRLVYAEMLARVHAEPYGDPLVPVREDLDLYDATAWLHKVLDPLPAWARAPATRERIAARTQVSPAEAARALDEVAGLWERSIETEWCADPGPGGPSLAGVLLPHLVMVHGALRRLMRANADVRANHRDMVLLYAAHDLSEARLDRLWVTGWADAGDPRAPVPPTDDIVGTSFWAAWLRRLRHNQLEPNTIF